MHLYPTGRDPAVHIKHWNAFGEGEKGRVLPDTLGVGKKQSLALSSK